jgi:ribosomal-protein-alanine N-acetyltransferase
MWLLMTMVVQKASIADLDTLYLVERQCFAKEAWSKRLIATFLKASDSVSLTVRENDEIVGFVIGSVNQYNEMKIGHILTIDVLPNHRQKGIGMTMLRSIEQEFKKAGVKICYLEVREDNLAAMKLYGKAGYVELERLENYYSRGGHGVRLEKTLLT